MLCTSSLSSPLDESSSRVVVESPRVRGGVGALPDVSYDLGERVSLHHQLIVFIYGARSQRSANLGDGDGGRIWLRRGAHSR